MMLFELAKSSSYLFQSQNSFQTVSRHRFLLRYFENKLSGNILDIGCRNPLKDKLCRKFNIGITNTSDNFDLDVDCFARCYENSYDIVLCIDVLEHLFNPLFCLLQIKRVMRSSAKLYIGLPRRGKLLWTDRHFHEIDDYRFRLLCKRTGLKIKASHKYKVWRRPNFYLKGIRPFLRLFFEFGIIYIMEKP